MFELTREGSDVREYDEYSSGFSSDGKGIWIYIKRASEFVWQFRIPLFAINDYKFVKVRPMQFKTRRRGLVWIDVKVYLHMEVSMYHEYTFGQIENWKKRYVVLSTQCITKLEIRYGFNGLRISQFGTYISSHKYKSYPSIFIGYES